MSVGYDDTSYESISNWDYKKKRPFKKKKLLVKNLNILLFSILICISIYIPLNYCIFNFGIPNKIEEQYNTANFDISDTRNICQNSAIYILNFKNIYISSIFYFIIFFAILYLLYILSFFTYLFKSIIKPNISYIIGCSYESIFDIKHSILNIRTIIKKRQYNKLLEIFKIIMILLIILLVLIAFTIFISVFLYNYMSNDNLNLENYDEKFNNYIDNINIPFTNNDKNK